MNAQQIFDTVARHLLTQRRKSQDDMGDCLYRGPDGTKCAAGVLIADKEYRPEMEMKYISHPLVWSALGIADKALSPLIRSLQFMHDDTQVSGWPMELKHIAEEYRVSDAVVVELATDQWSPSWAARTGETRWNG